MLGDIFTGEREGVQTVRLKSLPMVAVTEEDDGDAGVPQFLHDFQSLRVSSDIPIHELNTQIIHAFLTKPTGKTRRLGENSDHE